MSYQRMASMTKDLYAQKVDVDAAVQAAVRRVQPLFAGKQQVRLEVQPTGIQAVSDTKWLGLVLEQLLTNAVKYTRRGFVKVYAQDGALVVEDSGWNRKKAVVHALCLRFRRCRLWWSDLFFCRWPQRHAHVCRCGIFRLFVVAGSMLTKA